MSETWQQKAFEVGELLKSAAREYPELAPLRTSYMNYARKRNLHKCDAVTTLHSFWIATAWRLFLKRKSTITRQPSAARPKRSRTWNIASTHS